MFQYYQKLESCTLFSDIPQNQFPRVLGFLRARLQFYEKGAIVRPPFAQVTEMGIVVSGLVYITKTNYKGDRTILSEIPPSKTFGESLIYTDSSNSPVEVVAAERTAIVFTSIKHALDKIPSQAATSPLYTTPEVEDLQIYMLLTKNFTKLLSERMMLVQIKNDILSQPTTRDKLLMYFEFESATRNSKTFKIHFSRDELADFLSINSSALSRELSKMQAEGILSFHKNSFTLITRGM